MNKGIKDRLIKDINSNKIRIGSIENINKKIKEKQNFLNKEKYMKGIISDNYNLLKSNKNPINKKEKKTNRISYHTINTNEEDNNLQILKHPLSVKNNTKKITYKKTNKNKETSNMLIIKTTTSFDEAQLKKYIQNKYLKEYATKPNQIKYNNIKYFVSNANVKQYNKDKESLLKNKSSSIAHKKEYFSKTSSLHKFSIKEINNNNINIRLNKFRNTNSIISNLNMFKKYIQKKDKKPTKINSCEMNQRAKLNNYLFDSYKDKNNNNFEKENKFKILCDKLYLKTRKTLSLCKEVLDIQLNNKKFIHNKSC